MTAVRCIDLCKTYRQGDQDIRALDHLDLDVEENGFVCLSAPSGGGKTTLLNTIGGLDLPDSGEVWVAGQRVDRMSKGELATLRLTRIGFVFQAYNLIPVLTARENVEFVMQVQGVHAAERANKALAILEEVGLEGLEDRRPAEMLVASNSASRLPGPSSPGRHWCWPTNRPRTWIRRRPMISWRCSSN